MQNDEKGVTVAEKFAKKKEDQGLLPVRREKLVNCGLVYTYTLPTLILLLVDGGPEAVPRQGYDVTWLKCRW
jgi:hypothetical protein